MDFLKERGFSRLEFEQEWDIDGGYTPLYAYKKDPDYVEESRRNKVVDISRRIRRRFLKAKPSFKEDVKEGERKQRDDEAKMMEKYRKEEKKN